MKVNEKFAFFEHYLIIVQISSFFLIKLSSAYERVIYTQVITVSCLLLIYIQCKCHGSFHLPGSTQDLACPPRRSIPASRATHSHSPGTETLCTSQMSRSSATCPGRYVSTDTNFPLTRTQNTSVTSLQLYKCYISDSINAKVFVLVISHVQESEGCVNCLTCRRFRHYEL